MTINPPGEPSPQSSQGPLLTRTSQSVRTIIFNRPAAFNAFNLELKAAFLEALTDAADDQSVRAVIITGSGRAFGAGQDLKEHQNLVEAGDPRVATTVRDFYNVAVTAIATMNKPVVAAVNGAAAGAGAAMAFACDLRIAAASAHFSMAFASVALSADSGASFTLPRLIGSGRAAAMMLLGERVPAAEALRIGLVNEVVADEELMGRANSLATRLAGGPTRAYSKIKASLRHAATSDLASALEFENSAQAELFQGVDHTEAIAAFVHKRPAHFVGR